MTNIQLILLCQRKYDASVADPVPDSVSVSVPDHQFSSPSIHPTLSQSLVTIPSLPFQVSPTAVTTTCHSPLPHPTYHSLHLASLFHRPLTDVSGTLALRSERESPLRRMKR